MCKSQNMTDAQDHGENDAELQRFIDCCTVMDPDLDEKDQEWQAAHARLTEAGVSVERY